MANQFVLCFMVGKRNIAVAAMWYPAAGIANKIWRIATAVLKKDDLLVFFN
jgi:hypothetical protein